MSLCFNYLGFILFVSFFLLIKGNDSATDNVEPTNNKIRRVILDLNPGADDAFALLWLMYAFKNELISIEALTTVHSDDIPSYYSFKNVAHMVNITKPTINKSKLRKKILQIPIAKSHANLTDINDDVEKQQNEQREKDFNLMDMQNMDGLYGFGEMAENYPTIFASDRKMKRSFKKASYSEDLLIEKILQFPNELSIVLIGPLTNLYLAEQKEPGILNLVRDIYIMGGSFTKNSKGGVTPLSERNFYSDKVALYKLFEFINADGVDNRNPKTNKISTRKPNIFIFPLDIASDLQFNLQHMGYLYTLLTQQVQTEIEMCRIKIEKEEENAYDGNPNEDEYDESDLYDSDRDRYLDDEDDETSNYECNQIALLYMFYERIIEESIRKSYVNGLCDCLQLHDAAVVGFLLYPHLYDFKYVHCNINKENGMIWYEQRLVSVTNDTITIPNCFVNLNVDAEQILHAFTRDSITLLQDAYTDYIEHMLSEMDDSYN